MEYTFVTTTAGHKVKVDKEDLLKVSGFRWHGYEARYRNGDLRTVYAKITFLKRALPMANVILGVPVGTIVDHIDGDGLNNTKINLRAATPGQNARNCRLSKNNTSGFKGVVWEADRQKWKARIKVNGKYKTLGRFIKKENAAEAYAKASKKYHGEFGRVE